MKIFQNMNQNKVKLIIDLTIFTVFALAMDPRSTGVPVHEWMTMASIAAIITHLLLSWNWIIEITKRLFGRVAGRARLNYILNWLLFIDMTLIMFTGIMISRSFLPYFGIQVAENFAMRRLHDATANLFIVLLGLHVALHWSWIVNMFNRFVIIPLKGKKAPQAVVAEKSEAQA